MYIHENRSKEVVFCKSILDMASIRQEGEIIFGMNLHIPSTTDYTDIARANPQLGEAFAAVRVIIALLLQLNNSPWCNPDPARDG